MGEIGEGDEEVLTGIYREVGDVKSSTGSSRHCNTYAWGPDLQCLFCDVYKVESLCPTSETDTIC